MDIVYQVREGVEGVIFATRSEAEDVAQIWEALENSKTWGEFRANLPAGQWEEHLREWFEEEPADEAPFNSDSVPGFLDGDYPQMLRQVALSWFPKDLIENYGEVRTTVFNGEFLYIPEENLDQVIADLEEMGFDVTPTDLEFGWSA